MQSDCRSAWPQVWPDADGIGYWLASSEPVRIRLATMLASTYTWAGDDVLSGGDDWHLLQAWLWGKAAG